MALAERADTEQVSRNTVNITPKLNNTSAQNMTANAEDHNHVTDDTGSESSWDSDAEDQNEMVKQQKDSSRTSRWAQDTINNSCLGTDLALIYNVIDMSKERYLSSVSARESLQSRPVPAQDTPKEIRDANMTGQDIPGAIASDMDMISEPLVNYELEIDAIKNYTRTSIPVNAPETDRRVHKKTAGPTIRDHRSTARMSSTPPHKALKGSTKALHATTTKNSMGKSRRGCIGSKRN